MGKKEKKRERKNKKIILIIVFVFVGLIAIGGTGYYFYQKQVLKTNKEIMDEIRSNLTKSILDYNEPVEYGTTWNYETILNKYFDADNLERDNVEILVNNQVLKEGEEIVFDKIQDYEIKFNLRENYNYMLWKPITEVVAVSKKFTIKVEDKSIPVITGVEDKTITVGDKIDLKSGIKATDSLDGELEVTIDGTVDTNKAGKYEIKVSAIDKNGNRVEEKFTVTVKDKPKTTTASGSSSGSKTSSSSSSKSSSSTSSSSANKNTVAGRLALAKTEAKNVVAKIIKPGMSDYDKAYAIMNYIFTTVDVQTNQSTEAYKKNFGNEAYAALILKIAACSGRCKAVTLLCDAAGLKSQHINKDQWTHQWNKVLIDGKWIILDSQAGILGGTKHPLED